MVFVALAEDQQMIRENVLRICADFGDDYWLARDEDGRFPEEFCLALAEAGYLGIAMPEKFGGSGLGITEAAVMVQAISGPARQMAASRPHSINVFGVHPIVRYGTDEQKQRWLPVMREDVLFCSYRRTPDWIQRASQPARYAMWGQIPHSRSKDLDDNGAGCRQDYADRPNVARQ